MQPISEFPPIRRNITIIGDSSVIYQNVAEALWGIMSSCVPKSYSHEFYLTDYVKQRDSLVENQHYTFLLLFRAFDRTLTGTEANEIVENVRKKILDTTPYKV